MKTWTMKRADQYAKGVNAAAEVLPGIRDELLLGRINPKESDVSQIARLPIEQRRECAERLRFEPPKPTKQVKRRDPTLAMIDKLYEEMKKPHDRVDENSILESMQAEVETMIRVCNKFFDQFPSLLTEIVYRDKVIEIMQGAKQFIDEIEHPTDNHGDACPQVERASDFAVQNPVPMGRCPLNTPGG